MAVRAFLLLLAAGFVWIAEAFLAIGLYGALEPRFQAPVAALLTALAAVLLTALFGAIALRRRRSSAALDASAVGLGALSAVTRFAERHPLATVAVAAGAGVLQAVLAGRRR